MVTRISWWFGLSVASVASAQDAHDSWRSTRTEHYRVHYPVALEPWALDAAAELEGIRSSVAAEVGYAPDVVVDVIVRDPMSEANGFALPLGTGPRMELWATAPDAASVIGHYDRWSRLLVTHEDTHLVHLLRPSRSPLERALSAATGLAPITWKAPRWVIEGYATVVEGRLTPFGRPNGDYRPLVLRSLAAAGRMPTYGELDGSPRFAGGSYAYLIGSAYLEWLERRAGPGSLRSLWARMTSREIRDFEDAFEGVFGDDPTTLYGQFTAELVADAVAVTAARPTSAGRPFAEVGWAVFGPDVAGGTFAYTRLDEHGRARIVVREVAVDDEAVAERAEDLAETLAADPDDVAPVPPRTAPHEEVGTRTRRRPVARAPRLTDDGTVWFPGWYRAFDGRLRYDVWTWEPTTGRERRVTRGADVREIAPAPDGAFAVGVRATGGVFELGEIDPSSGSFTAYAPGEVGVLYGSPDVSPDGAHVAYAVHRGAGWTIEVRAREGGAVTAFELPEGSTATFPRFSDDGSRVLASVGRGGFVEGWSFPTSGGAGQFVADAPGGVIGPVEAEPGRLLFATTTPGGLDLHEHPLGDALVAPGAPASLSVRGPGSTPPPPSRAAVPGGRRYGLGRPESMFTAGGVTGPGGSTGEIGLRIGDLLGRHEILAIGAGGTASNPEGGRLAATLRTRPFDVVVGGFAVGAPAPDLRAGFDVAVRREGWAAGAPMRVGVGFVGDAPTDDLSARRGIVDLDLGVGWRGARSGALFVGLEGHPQLGLDASGTWLRADGAATIRVGRGSALVARYAAGTSGGDPFAVGGLRTSLLPDALQVSQVPFAAFARDSWTGRRHDAVRVALERGASVFYERHRVWDDAPGGAAAAIGVDVAVDLAAQPLVRLPSGRLVAGLACRVETPEDGWLDRPCSDVDRYAAWVGLRWGVTPPR